MLKTFLAYAATGVLGVAQASERGFGSPFEAAVAQRADRQGHEVDSQVGVAGFCVDLAVLDPARPGRYLLGIECDGAAYHSALSARDRDRLRQQVLEDLGWSLHRIWSADWLRDPEGELRRIAAALEEASARWAARDESLEVEVAFAEADEAGDGADGARDGGGCRRPAEPGAAAYVEAAFELAAEGEPAAPAAEPRWPMRWCGSSGSRGRCTATRSAAGSPGSPGSSAPAGASPRRSAAVSRARCASSAWCATAALCAARDDARRCATARGAQREPAPARDAAAGRDPGGDPPGHRQPLRRSERRDRARGRPPARLPAPGARLRTLIETEVQRLLASGRLDRQGASLVRRASASRCPPPDQI